MTLIDDILRYKSLAIVGMEKNTGKTECLNYILRNLPATLRTAVTSIGTDGERIDSVTRTSKPEILLREGTVFGTAEKYYSNRHLLSEILDVSGRATSLGRTVTGRALSGGKVMLSGPPSTAELKRWMDSLEEFGVELVIVDGALSRMSLASPAVAGSMILSSGAAFSADMNTLVRETAYRVELVNLPLAHEKEREAFSSCDKGIWTMNRDGGTICLSAVSGLIPETVIKNLNGDYDAVYIAGALTPRLLKLFSAEGTEGKRIIVSDFTKIFVPLHDYRAFTVSGGKIEVLGRSSLLAVCVNPVSPNGMVLDSDLLVRKISESVNVPVYDIMKCDAV